MMAETHVDDPRLMRGGTVICPNCHTPMADDARFCTQCGTKLEPPQEQSASEGKKTARHVAIIVAACAIVLIAVVGLWSWREHQRQEELAQQAAYEYERQSVTIPLLVEISGWDTAAGASRLPIHVTGADLDGNEVDETCYIDTQGMGLALLQGSYTLAVAASPIGADGTIWAVPDKALAIEVTLEGATTQDGTSPAFQLQAIEAQAVTDSEIDAAVSCAADDPSEDAPDADALREAAVAHRDEALQAEQAEQQELLEQQAREARHVVAASYELHLPEYWDGRVDVEVSGDNVIVYSRAYPRLEVCRIFVQNGPSDVMGDIGNATMGDVALGGGRYACVWATRWGWIIADAYRRNSTNPADYYSQAEADEIVDLQTGGATTYDVIREEVVASGSGSAVFLVDEFMREHVTNAIRAR